MTRNGALVLTLLVAAGLTAPAADAPEVSGSKPLRAAIERFQGSRKGYVVKIIGGRDAAWRDHPWQVALLHANDPDSIQAQFCGGSILANNWVLTAAHCVDNRTRPDQVEVLSGTATLGPGAHRGKVDAIYVHEAYSQDTFDSDIALIKLRQPANGDPVTLPGPDEESKLLVPGLTLMVSGWGTTESGLASPVLKEVEVPFQSREKCNGPASYNGRITENMLCAGYDGGGKDSCQGDSGGPSTNARRLVGVVSWGEGCANAFKYGVYTRVARFKPWIDRCMARPETCPVQ